jgi:hypothetical protein
MPTAPRCPRLTRVRERRAAGEAYFQYGPTVSYGMVAPVIDVGTHSSSSASARIARLAPNTIYHYLETIETEHHILG